MHCAGHAPLDVAEVAFGLQHADDLLRALVAEKLAQGLLVIPDAVALDQGDEVLRREAREGGATKVRIAREEVFRAAMNVREVAAPAAGDADLLAQLAIVLDEQHPPPALARPGRAHHARGARADDDDVEDCGVRFHGGLARGNVSSSGLPYTACAGKR